MTRLPKMIGLTLMTLSVGCAGAAQHELGEGWQRSGRPLLTNFDNMYGPCVVETPGAYRYRMWFFGWAAGHTNPGVPGCDAIFHARSRDLLHWDVYSRGDTWDATMNPSKWKPVLHASERWYEARHVGDPSVVLKDGTFYMAYSATSKHFDNVPGYPATMVQCVMGATSEDGIHWRKTAAPLLEDWPNPEVVKVGDTYHCFGDPPGYPIKEGESGWKSRQLREAVSTDALTWRPLDFIDPDEDADACHVPQALVTEIDGRKWLYLFYSTQIGYKKADGQYHYQYDRIRAMRREIGADVE